jgi:hypothetical protein
MPSSSGKGFGKPNTLGNVQPNLLKYCDRLIAGEFGFIILDFWADAGGIATIPIAIAELNDNHRLAYDLVHQPSFMNVGIRRQHEQSLGMMEMMDRHFREEVLNLRDTTHQGQFVFNWYSQQEMTTCYQESKQAKKGRASVFGVITHLIASCDRRFQFPCMFSGIPTEDEKAYTELIFVCDSRNISEKKIASFIAHENFS